MKQVTYQINEIIGEAYMALKEPNPEFQADEADILQSVLNQLETLVKELEEPTEGVSALPDPKKWCKNHLDGFEFDNDSDWKMLYKIMEQYAAQSKPTTEEQHCNHQWQEVWKDNNHQSSWGANRCMKCGYIEEWQYDSPNIKNE